MELSGVQGRLVEEFTSLYEAVKRAEDNIKMCRTVFEDLKLTVYSLQPLVREKIQPDISGELIIFPEQMQKGVQLVRKCSNRRFLSAIKSHHYNRKLTALAISLQRLVHILRIQAMENVEKTWESINNAETMLVKEITYNRVLVPPYFTVGLDGPLAEVKMKLLWEDMSVLVLTGPGGCGKTTLATSICFNAHFKERFRDNIFFIMVGKRSSMSSILQQLNQQVRWSTAPPTFQDRKSEVAYLHTLLKELERQDSLFIFDDVWSESVSLIEEFFHIGRVTMSNSKILVTARRQFPQLGSPYYLNLLNDEDSMTLFYQSAFRDFPQNKNKESAFREDMGSYIPVELCEEIVKHCKGLPLAIKVVGNSLCGKPIQIWRNTLFKWSDGYSILDYENEFLLSVLQSSLEDLGKENHILLESFLDLASFPHDQAIHVPAIFDVWAQRYDLREDSMYSLLYELTTRSLVNVVVRRNVEDYSEHFVTQHDMLRSLAIRQTRHDPVLSKRLNIDIRGDTVPKWWTEVTEQMKKPKKIALLSLSTDEAFSANWPTMQPPVAKVLVLNLRTKNYELPKFIRDMHKSLKVLIVQNYGSATAEISHFHRLSSLSNLETIRLHRITVPSLTKNSTCCFQKNSTYLKSLQKISFFMCNISQAFGKDASRISRALPLVVTISIDCCRDLVELQDDICNLVHLKKLSITNCHRLSALPEKLGKLTNMEVLILRSCSDLVKLPNTIGDLKKLNFLDISHCFSIKELPEEIGALTSLRKLNMRECSRLQELPASFFDLDGLKVVICDKYTQYLWEPFALTSTEIRVVKENPDPLLMDPS